ncbi:hypothetical protein [Corallococcus llansteffanensis]|uniref:Uncharacterized protein n=1 Tax=Corallococcus llansteffanensis TaxID=2316731 RepID=A0A3A8QCL2_9BACT|nr:hypothetical protein [Corallococcus llansteffanensis]RKH66479.1 hypothetical protein D7V93_04425 [Corallococcus llansteffanensis]
MDVASALRGLLASRGRWLCLWPCLLTVACATTASNTRVPTLEENCNGGSASACEVWGQQLLVDHRTEDADRAFGLACAMGSTSACLTQGRDRLERGDLEGAEPPLRKAYDEELEEGALALADLQEARGDAAGASRFRYEALSIDKSTTEFALGWRIPWNGGLGWALDVNVQPMGLKARRLTLGLNLGFDPERASLNATVGYQHFVTNWMAPYARALVGPHLQGSRRNPLNLGAEAGVKLFAGPIGHLGVAMGASFDGSVYTVIEAGLDWVLTLVVLAHL